MIMPNQSFAQALEYYRSQHQTKGCQLTHLFGVPLIAISFPLMVFNFRRGLAFFAAGWFLQFIGHFYFEKNRPVVITRAASTYVPIAALVVVGQYWKTILYGIYACAQGNGQVKTTVNKT